MNRYQWRPMTVEDLAYVMQIAAQVHAGYYEALEVFAERLALFPQGCRIATCLYADGAEQIIGYAFLHPTRHGHPPALNRLLQAIDGAADCLHLHDVALLMSARGSGLGRLLVTDLRQIARDARLVRATLVAVHDSAAYWRAAGFDDDWQLSPPGRQALAGYGDAARYMSMALR